MEQSPDDQLQGAIVLFLIVASLATWWYLAVRMSQRGHILPYKWRRPVPWGFPAAALAFVIVLLTMMTAFLGEPAETADDLDASKAAAGILAFMLFQVVVGGAALMITVIVSRPDRDDLGWPEYVHELVRDLQIGAVAFLAAIAPVFGTLILVRSLEGSIFEPSHHPLVESVTRTSNIEVLILASVSAVVFAPIFEEFVFRVLLQGWLEKWEDTLLGWRQAKAPTIALAALDEARPTDETVKSTSLPLEAAVPTDPPRHGVAGLPYGWLPIIISSALFALAHFGYGPEPVPLFVLALILGYVYQRTHSIVPCIVTHALFNSITVIMLWQMVSFSAER